MQPTKIAKPGLDLIKHYEGFRADAYRCPANVWTIGYGHTKGVKEGDKVTRDGGTKFLQEDVKDAEDGVKNFVSVDLTQNQYDALVSFIFNLGTGNFVKSTLLKKLNARDYAGCAGQFGLWNKAGGKVLDGLVKRRASELRLFNGKPTELK